MEFPEIPGYTIISRLGSGGMASIYLAEQASFQRKVALKVMAPHLVSDPSFGDRFLREARMASNLVHPSFAQIYDVGRSGDYHYLSMEYVPGGSLKARMIVGLPLAEGIRIVQEIAAALNYADSHHFVHRDIKPDNVLLRNDMSAVICDFGIAKNIGSETQLTQIGAILGTPNYMSPEQVQGVPVDGRSDLYSLGVIFYEMLAGQVPFRGDTAVATGIMHISSPVPRLPDEFAIFQAFIDRALAKRPENRFQSGAEMMNALQDVEEEHFDLIQKGSTTVTILVSADNANSGWGSGLRQSTSAQRRSGSRSARGRAKAGVTTRGVRPSATVADNVRAGWMPGWVMALSAVATLGVGAGGWWLYTHNNSPKSIYDAGTPGALILPNTAQELEGLLTKATQAMDEGRLFGTNNDDAQTYLTILLERHPDDEGGKSGIARLFAMYLEQAGEELEAGDLVAAGKTLEHASSISYLVSDRALVKQQKGLQNTLIAARRQVMISKERAQQIADLLALAQGYVKDGALISPAGGNAYDRYQEILAIDPNNQAAREGISNIVGGLLQKAKEKAQQGELGPARSTLTVAAQLDSRHPDLAATRELVAAKEAEAADRLISEEEKRSAEQETQRLALVAERGAKLDKISSLLAAAQTDLQAGRLDAPPGKNAVDRYKEVISLDSANIEALNGFEAVADRFIDQAKSAIQAGKLDNAGEILQRAKQLSPTNPRYAQMQTALIAARDQAAQQAEEESTRQKRLSQLLANSRAAVKAGNIYLPQGNNALEMLREIQELDSGNAEASKLRDELLQRVAKAARADIDQRRFVDAQLAIAALENSDADTGLLGGLRTQLTAEQAEMKQEETSRTKANEEQRLAQEKAAQIKADEKQLAGSGVSETESERLERERLARVAEEKELAQKTAAGADKLLRKARELGKISNGNHRELGTLYTQVLGIDRNNAAARSGLAAVADYSAGEARQSVENKDFGGASREMDYLREIVPESALLGPLQEALAYAQRQQSQATEILAAADALIATPYKKPGMFENNSAARQTLKSALDKIRAVRKVDPATPALAASEQKLLDKYLGIIGTHLQDGDADQAREFMDDLRATGLGDSTLASLEKKVSALAQTKKKADLPAVGSF